MSIILYTAGIMISSSNFKIQSFRSREAINKLMMKKFNDIIIQYGKEVEKMEAIFNAYRDKPPIHKNHPPGRLCRFSI